MRSAWHYIPGQLSGCLWRLWVRELSDEDAYMQLALCNAQGELHPLEVGMHALGSGMSVRDYAEKVGRAKTSIQDRWQAAAVLGACTDIRTEDAWKSMVGAFHSPLRPPLALACSGRQCRICGTANFENTDIEILDGHPSTAFT